MHLSISLVLFFFLSFNVFASPTPYKPTRHPQTKSIRIPRIKRSGYIAHGPHALRKAYRKYGITPTHFDNLDLADFKPLDGKLSLASGNQASAEPDQTGAVSATSVKNDVEFVSPVTIGGQNITLDFDTGSADLYESQLISSLTNSKAKLTVQSFLADG